MRKVLSFLYFFVGIIVLTACTGASSSDTSTPPKIFATHISFRHDTVNYIVGDEVKITNAIINLEPRTATITRIATENNNIAKYIEQENKIIFTGAGITNVFAFAEGENGEISCQMTVVVNEKPVYATNASFEHSQIHVNFNEFNVENKLNITLENNTIILYNNYLQSGYNEYEDVVTYSRVGIVNYNPLTGQITPLTTSNAVENVTVKVKIKAGKFTFITRQFEVVVTNYIYATSLDFENIDISNSNPITLFANSNFSLMPKVLPNNYNLDIKFESLHSNLVVSNNGVITTPNFAVENAQVKVSVNSGKNEIIEKIINIHVVVPATELNIELKDEFGNNVNALYPNKAYYLTVNSNVALNDLKLSKLLNNTEFSDFYNISKINSNTYELTITKVNELITKIALTYENVSFNNTFSVTSNVLTVKTYNYNNNFNFLLQNNNTFINEISPNTYKLTAIDYDEIESAQQHNVHFMAEINVFESTPNILLNNYSVYVVNENELILLTEKFENSVAKLEYLENNNIIILAFSAGTITLKVVSNDSLGYYEYLTINIKESVVENINYSKNTSTIKLYTNTENQQLSQLNLNEFSVVPSYALNKGINFEIEGNSVFIENGFIKSQSVGESELIITAGNVVKTYTVVVQAVADYVEVTESNELIGTNLNQIIITTDQINKVYKLKFTAIHNSQNVNHGTFTLEFVNEIGKYSNNENQIVEYTMSEFGNGAFTLISKALGVQYIQYTYSDTMHEITGIIKFVVESPYSEITNLKFNYSQKEYNVNLYFTNEIETNDIIVETTNEKPYLESRIEINSSHNRVLVSLTDKAIINYSVGHVLNTPIVVTVSLLLDGNVVDYYTINIYYEEPLTYIENVIFNYNDLEINTFEQKEFINVYTLVKHDENLNHNDVILFSVNENNYATINQNTGKVTFNENVKTLQNSQILVVTLTTSGSFGVKEFTYQIIIYYEEPKSQIIDIEFENNVIEINTFYNLVVINPHAIYYDFNEYETNNTLVFTISSTEFAQINSQNGVVVFNENVSQISGILTLTVTATTTGNYGVKTYSYVINATYEPPHKQIENVTFNNEILSVNAYIENTIYNAITITYDSGVLDTNNTLEYSISSNNFAQINSQTGVITFNENVASLSQTQTLIVTLKTYGIYGVKEFNYELVVFYEIVFDEVYEIDFVNNSFTLNFANLPHVITNEIIINNYQTGMYNLNNFEVVSTNLNFEVNLKNGVVEVVVNSTGSATIIVTYSNNNGVAVSSSFDIEVSSDIVITNELQLSSMLTSNSTYVLGNDITLSENFATILNFTGKLNGNGHTITITKNTLFNTISEDAEIYNLNLNVNISQYISAVDYDGLEVNVIAPLAVLNFGLISNVSIVANVNATNISNVYVSALVHTNFGEIVNSEISMISSGNSSNYASSVAVVNYGLIENVEVKNSEFNNYGFVAGFVLYNYGALISNNVSVHLHGATNTRRAGFVYTSNESMYSVQNINSNSAHVTFTYEGDASTKNSYAFIGALYNTTIQNNSVVVNYNHGSLAEFSIIASGNKDNHINSLVLVEN